MVGIPLDGMARACGIDPLNVAPPPEKPGPAHDAPADSFQSHLQVRREPSASPARPDGHGGACEAEPPREALSSGAEQAEPAGQDSQPPQETPAAEQRAEQPEGAADRELDSDHPADDEAGGPHPAALLSAAETCEVPVRSLPAGDQFSETVREPDEPATEQATPQQQAPRGATLSLTSCPHDEDPLGVLAQQPPEKTSVQKPQDASGPEGAAVDGQPGAGLAGVPGGAAEEAAEPAALPAALPPPRTAPERRGTGRPSPALADALQLPIDSLPSRPAEVQGTSDDPQEPGRGPANSNTGAERANGSPEPTAAAPASHGLAQHLLPRGGERANAEPHLSGSDQARLVERVARAVRLAENGQGVVRLRLSPPELGALKLEVKVHSGVLTARLEVETAQARHVLVDNLPLLRERLGELGVRVEQFDVDVPDRQAENPSGGPEGRDRGRQHGQGAAATDSPFGQPADELPAASNQSPLARLCGREQLNVVI